MILARQRLFRGLSPDQEAFRKFLDDILTVAGWNYDAQAASKWGDGFCLPNDVSNRDVALFSRHNHNIVEAVTGLRRTTVQHRLNPDRVSRCVSINDPDYERILELATIGIRVHTSSEFQPNLSPPKLRQLYLQTSGAVDRMLYELHQDNLLFILPL